MQIYDYLEKTYVDISYITVLNFLKIWVEEGGIQKKLRYRVGMCGGGVEEGWGWWVVISRLLKRR